jgi:hypothetical protein
MKIDIKQLQKVSLEDNELLLIQVPKNTEARTYELLNEILRTYEITRYIIHDEDIEFKVIKKI